MIGQIIIHYQMLENLGEGAMSQTFPRLPPCRRALRTAGAERNREE
jgi:hypothetical protein